MLVNIDPPFNMTASLTHVFSERIADQKFAVRALVTLYRHSINTPGRIDPLQSSTQKGMSVNPGRIFKKLRHGVRMAATTTTTALGNVASEIAGRWGELEEKQALASINSPGSSVLQPNSPPAMVKTALESANKSRLVCAPQGLLLPVLIFWSLLVVYSIHFPNPIMNICWWKILKNTFQVKRRLLRSLLYLTRTEMGMHLWMRLRWAVCKYPLLPSTWFWVHAIPF